MRYHEIIQDVAEGVPQPGPSSGAPKQFGADAEIQTRQMTAKEIISSVSGVPYYNNVIDDWDAKDYSWGVTKKVIEYATYLKQHPESLSKLPPAIVLNGKFEDGAHRVSALWLLQQRMDPKNPLWANAKLNVQFVKQGVAEGIDTIPATLYHATYRPLLKSIKQYGLGGDMAQAKWEDSKLGVVYLALDKNVAESYAETSDVVPDEWLDDIVVLKISTNGLDTTKFHLDRNVQDNQGDTVEYHGVIPVSNIKMIKQGVAEGSENLNYIGNCTDDDVIEHIFGDATNFAQAVEEHGDEFTIDDLIVKYDPETDIHSFYYKKQGVAEGLEQISIKVRKKHNKFATELSVDGKTAGVYQYHANTGRSIAEVFPEYKGKGYGKILVLHAIYTAAKLGMDFVEDESRTSEYDNVLDSLSNSGYIVDDDGYWYVTGEGEQYLKQRLKQGVAENFADGKVKGKSRPGRVKRAGASCKGSVSSLRAKAKRSGGERGKMYHWCANMKSGRKKANEAGPTGLEFKGYPCTKDCSGHQAGHDWAERWGIEDPGSCPYSNNSFWEGCLARTDDFQDE